MKVRIVRSGGFSGVRLTTEVDDPAEAESMSTAVRASAAREPDPRARDAFSYEFTVETRTRTETFDLAESQLVDSLRAMIRTLADRGRRTT